MVVELIVQEGAKKRIEKSARCRRAEIATQPKALTQKNRRQRRRRRISEDPKRGAKKFLSWGRSRFTLRFASAVIVGYPSSLSGRTRLMASRSSRWLKRCVNDLARLGEVVQGFAVGWRRPGAELALILDCQPGGECYIRVNLDTTIRL